MRRPEHDEDWNDLANAWDIRKDTIYLNHGSFGPPPRRVLEAQQQFSKQLAEQPMDFYLRQFEGLLDDARQKLASFVGTQKDNLVFAENATFGMNVVADSFPLQKDDEVILNNHEYGAVKRIWQRAAERVGAKVIVAELPMPIESEQQVVNCLLDKVNQKTKLLVISHITSATALIFPVKEICDAFSNLQIPICIDGPHAPAQIELDIDQLNCDFYSASCHKWLNAGLGSGFLYVASRWQNDIQPQLQSWGRLHPAVPSHWTEEFTWSGTRNPASYLSIPIAIDFLEEIGLENFRARSRWLAEYGETQLTKLFGNSTLAERKSGWYGSMCHVALPSGDFSKLQDELWRRFQIEIPVFMFEDKDYLRLSCHLYNSTKQIDSLVKALKTLL